MTAPTPHDHAERAQGEVMAAVRRAYAAADEAAVSVTPPDGVALQAWLAEHGTLAYRHGMAHAALVAALDVEEMAKVLGRHDEIEWGTRERTDRCKCGHDLETGGPAVDGAYLALNEHAATALRAALLGGAA